MQKTGQNLPEGWNFVRRDTKRRTEMTETIKCCPFCGSHEIEICRTNPLACWIRCGDCGSDAKSAETRAEAIALWNSRHYDDKPATVVDDGDNDWPKTAMSD